MKRGFRIALLVWTLASAGFAAELYTISGVVINAATGTPLARARAALMNSGSTRVVASMTTGEGARFSFQVPAGKYELMCGTRDVLQPYGRRAPDSLVGSAIIAGPGQDTANLAFQWFPTASITGTVKDDHGEPVENAIVQLIRSAVIAGRRLSNTVVWARSDDRGEYRFWRLVGGTYFLAVTGQPWYTERPDVFEAPGASADAYLPVYYPATFDPAQAAPMVLRPGEEARADFTLQTVPGVNVKISYEAGTGLAGNVGLTRESIVGSEGFQVQERIVPIGQTLRGVPPGHYVVKVNGMMKGAPASARQDVEIGGSDVEVKVAVHPPASLSGSVEFENPNMRPKGTVLVGLRREQSTGTVTTAIRPDGSFTLEGMTVEPFRVAILGMDGYFASAVRVDGAEYRNGIVEMTDGSAVTLRIKVSDRTGRVEGFVKDGEKPVVGAMVVLAPADLPNDWMRYYGFQTDSDGSFDWPNVREGEYVLFATGEQALEYTKPSAVKPYLAGAERVSVQAHGKVVRNLAVTAGQATAAQ